jgi:hypothetical protein
MGLINQYINLKLKIVRKCVEEMHYLFFFFPTQQTHVTDKKKKKEKKKKEKGSHVSFTALRLKDDSVAKGRCLSHQLDVRKWKAAAVGAVK